jgi:hypothetical protein
MLASIFVARKRLVECMRMYAHARASFRRAAHGDCGSPRKRLACRRNMLEHVRKSGVTTISPCCAHRHNLSGITWKPSVDLSYMLTIQAAL